MSIVSGTAIAEALAGAGHPVELVLIDLAGGWWWLPADHRRDDRPGAAYDDPGGLGADGPLAAGAALDRLAGARPAPVVFIALHGPFGEDGTIQALLEAAGLAYTGSGVTASAIGMDKAVFKRLTRGIGLPIVDWIEVRASRWATERAAVLGQLEAFAAGTGDPRLMVKPSRLGSSVGMTLAHGPEEYAAALDEAFRFDTVALAEAYLAGARDLEVSVIGNDHARLELFGPGEIVAGHEFYDYAAKYTPGLSESSITAEVSTPMRVAILKIARDAYRAIGAEGFARIDFLLRGDDLFLSEINTIPGFTPISLFDDARRGLSFTTSARVVDLGIERHERGPAERSAGRPAAMTVRQIGSPRRDPRRPGGTGAPHVRRPSRRPFRLLPPARAGGLSGCSRRLRSRGHDPRSSPSTTSSSRPPLTAGDAVPSVRSLDERLRDRGRPDAQRIANLPGLPRPRSRSRCRRRSSSGRRTRGDPRGGSATRSARDRRRPLRDDRCRRRGHAGLPTVVDAGRLAVHARGRVSLDPVDSTSRPVSLR